VADPRGSSRPTCNNDYVSGAHEVRAATGAELCLPGDGGYWFDHRPMAEGDVVRIGDLVVHGVGHPGPHAGAPGLACRRRPRPEGEAR